MSREVRRGFTAAEKTEMWDRWQRGESLTSIGRAFGKESARGRDVHVQSGGKAEGAGAMDSATSPATANLEPGKPLEVDTTPAKMWGF